MIVIYIEKSRPSGVNVVRISKLLYRFPLRLSISKILFSLSFIDQSIIEHVHPVIFISSRKNRSFDSAHLTFSLFSNSSILTETEVEQRFVREIQNLKKSDEFLFKFKVFLVRKAINQNLKRIQDRCFYLMLM